VYDFTTTLFCACLSDECINLGKPILYNSTSGLVGCESCATTFSTYDCPGFRRADTVDGVLEDVPQAIADVKASLGDRLREPKLLPPPEERRERERTVSRLR
jgi:hypothetical protein